MSRPRDWPRREDLDAVSASSMFSRPSSQRGGSVSRWKLRFSLNHVLKKLSPPEPQYTTVHARIVAGWRQDTVDTGCHGQGDCRYSCCNSL